MIDSMYTHLSVDALAHAISCILSTVSHLVLPYRTTAKYSRPLSFQRGCFYSMLFRKLDETIQNLFYLGTLEVSNFLE
jgi:hypothetical protein